MMSNWKEASGWYEKAVAGKAKDQWHLAFCKSLQNTGRYDEAIAQYNAYKALALKMAGLMALFRQLLLLRVGR
ncbi:MAG: hypothetical protein IPI23_10605 [Bacteroidetes bacterium]|nr:hypothetical protein [Bacteroidota bacterium]